MDRPTSQPHALRAALIGRGLARCPRRRAESRMGVLWPPTIRLALLGWIGMPSHRVMSLVLLAALTLWFGGAVQFIHERQDHAEEAHAAQGAGSHSDDDSDAPEPGHGHSHDDCAMCQLLACPADLPTVPPEPPTGFVQAALVPLPPDLTPPGTPVALPFFERGPPILPA
jgi:hypothetical protein